MQGGRWGRADQVRHRLRSVQEFQLQPERESSSTRGREQALSGGYAHTEREE